MLIPTDTCISVHLSLVALVGRFNRRIVPTPFEDLTCEGL